MNVLGLVILGAIIIFGVPAGIGYALARWQNNIEAGIAVGVVMFLTIVILGYRHMMKEQGKGDHRNDI